MKLRGRLVRLEEQAVLMLVQHQQEDDDDPPCSPWFDPQEWASRKRLSRLLMRQFTPDVASPEPKGTTDQERRCAEELTRIFQRLANEDIR